MPALSPRFSSAVKDFYRFAFSDDGYPCQKRPDGSLFEHPIYPVYVLNDYLLQLNADPDNPELRAAIDRIVHAVLARARTCDDALFLIYDTSAGVSRALEEHPSGLTQAYYADLFSRLTRVMPERTEIAEAADAFYRSAFIPVEKGGVARTLPGGVGIEEVPLEHPDLVLNGWLSALKALMDVADRSRGWSKDPRLVANIDLLEALLPLYDHTPTANSRYSLSGAVQFRLQAQPNAPVILDSLSVDYGEPQAEALKEGPLTGWTNAFEASDALLATDGAAGTLTGVLRLNFVWSRLRNANRLQLQTRPGSGPLKVQVLVGEYNPLAAGPTNRRWIDVSTISPEEAGPVIAIDPPSAATDLIGYPTNFMKKIGGAQRNVYHAIHINRLWQLAARTKRPIFKMYARKWSEYAMEWSSNKCYADLNIEPVQKRIPNALLRYVERQRNARKTVTIRSAASPRP
jgi:hypothetical protein